MIFEWDEEKDITNIRKHGLSFKDASAQYSLNLQVLMRYPVGACKEEYETLAC